MGLRKEGYWEEHYELELKNFRQHGDQGEVWFGKSLSRRINDWILSRIISKDDWSSNIKMLDIGCGNSFTLTSLIQRHQNVKSNLKIAALGIDYAKNSIELSKKIVADLALDGNIELIQCDFLNVEQLNSASRGEKFDFIVDKGTYDAICLLAGDKLEETRTKYMKSLHTLVKAGSIFILASCNYTEDELLPLFNIECSFNISFRLRDTLDTPKIQFGGKEGSQATCLVLEACEH